MSKQSTYWHLEHLGRQPSAYEVVTSRLLYHPQRGLEVSLPMETWYRKYQAATPLRCSDWEKFLDPAEMTYARYVEAQKANEEWTDDLVQSIEDGAHDRGLSATWVRVLNCVVAPMRYPLHGLQMLASYVGHMAPCGKLVVASLFQTADELRRIHRIEDLMRRLRRTYPGFGADSQALWQNDPMWQPWRRLIETLLVTYDWGEAFVAVNLVAKPIFDELFIVGLGRLAQNEGDDVLAQLLRSFNEDSVRNREWCASALRLALTDREENRSVVDGWIDRWWPVARCAACACAIVFDDMSVGKSPAFAEVEANALAAVDRYWREAGLERT